MIFPGQPAILILTEAIRQKEARYRKPRSAKPRQRTLKVSVPLVALPTSWKDALKYMQDGFGGGDVTASSPNMIPTYEMKLRQFAWSANNAGLPVRFSVDAVKAYVKDVRGRGLVAVTQLASFSALKKSARYVAADQEVLELLSELMRATEGKARKAPKKKYEKLQKTGYSPVQIVDQAVDLLAETQALTCLRAQQARRNTAAALALFSVLPIRLADTRLNFGEHLSWREGRYELHLTMSKNEQAYGAEIDPHPNQFIDALILRGCDEAWLDQMRADCLESNRPLFIRNDGEGVGYNYISGCWRSIFGTGEHISRTILHTFLGIELGSAGTDMALAANGQKSPKTAAAYQDQMVSRARRLQCQKSFEGMVGDTHQRLFEFT